MTQEELILFKELVKEAVRSAVKDAVREEVNEILKKELKEVKLIMAKTIKEVRETKEAPIYQSQAQPVSNPSEFKARLREAVGSDFGRRQQAQPIIPQMTQETAMNMSVNGSLPNIDAPIPFINKDSIAWKEMREKLS